MNGSEWARRVADLWIPVEGRFWRMHEPRHAYEPLSGEGARRHGGRWNGPGQSALYLSTTHATAIAEVQQFIVQPGTLVPYDVVAPRIVDLTREDIAREIDPADRRACAWQRIWRVEGRRPPTWDMADRLIAAGADGVLTPSVVGPDPSLVLWRWNESDVVVTVIDPNDTLSRG